MAKRIRKPRAQTREHKLWIPPVMVCCDQVERVTFCVAENFTIHVKVECKAHKTFFAENPLPYSRHHMSIALTEKFRRRFEKRQKRSDSGD